MATSRRGQQHGWNPQAADQACADGRGGIVGRTVLRRRPQLRAACDVGVQDHRGFRAADDHGCIVVGDREHRSRRHRISDLAAPLSPRTTITFARPPQRRSRRLEPGHQLRPRRRRQLQRPRRRRPRRAVPHRRRGDRRGQETVGLVGQQHHRGGPCRRNLQRRRPRFTCPTTTAATSTSAVRIGAARSPQGQAGDLPGRVVGHRAGVRCAARRSHLHRAGQPRPGAGLLSADP